MSLLKRNEAKEQVRVGNYTKAITYYLEIREEDPCNVEIIFELAQLYYLNRQYEKAIQNYLIVFHFYASAHFKQNLYPSLEAKRNFIATSNIAFHIGCAQVALNFDFFKIKLSPFFDPIGQIENYRASLISRPSKICDEYTLFCSSIGCHLLEDLINWESLQLRNTPDVKNMIHYYESHCSENKRQVA